MHTNQNHDQWSDSPNSSEFLQNIQEIWSKWTRWYMRQLLHLKMELNQRTVAIVHVIWFSLNTSHQENEESNISLSANSSSRMQSLTLHPVSVTAVYLQHTSPISHPDCIYSLHHNTPCMNTITVHVTEKDKDRERKGDSLTFTMLNHGFCPPSFPLHTPTWEKVMTNCQSCSAHTACTDSINKWLVIVIFLILCPRELSVKHNMALPAPRFTLKIEYEILI